VALVGRTPRPARPAREGLGRLPQAAEPFSLHGRALPLLRVCRSGSLRFFIVHGRPLGSYPRRSRKEDGSSLGANWDRLRAQPPPGSGVTLHRRGAPLGESLRAAGERDESRACRRACCVGRRPKGPYPSPVGASWGPPGGGGGRSAPRAHASKHDRPDPQSTNGSPGDGSTRRRPPRRRPCLCGTARSASARQRERLAFVDPVGARPLRPSLCGPSLRVTSRKL
jgi:hypothetical protein